MRDKHGRDIYYLRLSVTDLCNLRCVYCMPECGIAKKPHSEILTIEELEELVRGFAACGIRKVRVTGGEPLVRRGIVDICGRIAAIEGIEELCLTTNGCLLPQFAADLKQAGVRRLNISLDSLDPDTYRKITRGGELEAALRGVETALETGFDAIKVNSVLMGGVNDDEIERLLEMTRKYPVDVRFIEVMPVGECAEWSAERFVGNELVLERAPELELVGEEGVAKLYRLPDGQGAVGLISPISSHFCPTCNRIRVTSDGMLKPCLHSEQEIPLRGLHGNELVQTIRDSILAKPTRHHLECGMSGAARNMNAIGG